MDGFGQYCKMSQSHNPKDTQALLQSMLQRLKLQPGKESQAYLHTPVPTTTASTWRQDGERAATNIQKVNSSPVNGFEFGSNGIPSKEFGTSAADSNFGLKGGKIQQPGGCEVDRNLFSFPSQKDNIDGDTGEDRVLGQATLPGITPRGRGQLFPAESLKDADITSFERTDRVSLGSSAETKHILSNKDAVTSMGQNPDLQVCKWSLKPANVDTGSKCNEVLHMKNREFGASAQSKDMQIIPTSSSSRRKPRPSENKTKRWTQKIKERWKDRPGSFGKKAKVEGGRVMVNDSEQGAEISTQKQLLTAGHLINTPNKEEEGILPSVHSSDRSIAPPTHTEDATNEGKMRLSSDFEFGLGSFSLLEEIVTGQQWAKFINPNQSAYSANQRPSELQIPPNPHDSGQSYLNLNQQGGVNNQWSLRETEASPDLDLSMAQISPDAFQAVSMDVSEGKQAAVRDVHSEADQSEPMEHGHTCRPPLFVKPENILDKLALNSRVHLNRKRQHQSAERRDERLQTEKISNGKEAYREGSISSLSLTSNHAMEETGESQHDNIKPLYTRNSNPPPLSPSTLFAPAPRGVLKHSISQESQSSMGTVTKRRRVEVNRRVRFSEEVVAITPPELDPDATDSEEDSGAEEDSVIEQECEQEEEEEEQAGTKRVEAPTRRPALPAWILALKKWNTGKKDRQGL
ncbi:uncharacterized protein zgc:113229 isoform X2 [Etheostoma spectabile]|uniref:uncharacterized protein zgc:113229 isoform X2 n=1 Tax=Etheostoma spectabile TaxID=54343 RepID=UPI0013AFDC08|nr:uncharacterized protein LOC116696321 isoform X2 [Etheostoma spectabile]